MYIVRVTCARCKFRAKIARVADRLITCDRLAHLAQARGYIWYDGAIICPYCAVTCARHGVVTKNMRKAA